LKVTDQGTNRVAAIAENPTHNRAQATSNLLYRLFQLSRDKAANNSKDFEIQFIT